MCKINPNSTDNYEYILTIKGFVKDTEQLNSKIDLTFSVNNTEAKMFGLNTGLFLLDIIVMNNIAEIVLVESLIYSLDIIAQPFITKLDNLSIEFDKSDTNKYYIIR